MNNIRIEQFVKEKKIHFKVNEESFWFKGNLIAFKKAIHKSKYLNKKEIKSYIELAESLIQVKEIKTKTLYNECNDDVLLRAKRIIISNKDKKYIANLQKINQKIALAEYKKELKNHE